MTGVQTCALPISAGARQTRRHRPSRDAGAWPNYVTQLRFRCGPVNPTLGVLCAFAPLREPSVFAAWPPKSVTSHPKQISSTSSVTYAAFPNPRERFRQLHLPMDKSRQAHLRACQRSSNPPAEPEAFRLLAPQRGLTAAAQPGRPHKTMVCPTGGCGFTGRHAPCQGFQPGW